MTEDSEQVVRVAYEAMAAGDTDAALELIDPDLEWIFLDPSEPSPEPRTCHGREQLAYALTRNSAQFRMELEEIVAYGPRALVVTHTPGLDAQRARKAGDRNFHVVTVGAGRIVRLQACRDRDEAARVAAEP